MTKRGRGQSCFSRKLARSVKLADAQLQLERPDRSVGDIGKNHTPQPSRRTRGFPEFRAKGGLVSQVDMLGNHSAFDDCPWLTNITWDRHEVTENALHNLTFVCPFIDNNSDVTGAL